MYTPVNPGFTTKKWGLRGSKLYKYVFVMVILFCFVIAGDDERVIMKGSVMKRR